MTRTRKKQSPSKELVPIKHPDWDQQVKDVLEMVHRYTRTGPDGYRSPPETRRALNVDAVSRLDGLVERLDEKLRGPTPKKGTSPVPESAQPTRVWPIVGDEAGF